MLPPPADAWIEPFTSWISIRWPGASWPVHSKSFWAAADGAKPSQAAARRIVGLSRLRMHASLDGGLDGKACRRVYPALSLNRCDARTRNVSDDVVEVADFAVLHEHAVRPDADAVVPVDALGRRRHPLGVVLRHLDQLPLRQIGDGQIQDYELRVAQVHEIAFGWSGAVNRHGDSGTGIQPLNTFPLHVVTGVHGCRETYARNECRNRNQFSHRTSLSSLVWGKS